MGGEGLDLSVRCSKGILVCVMGLLSEEVYKKHTQKEGEKRYMKSTHRRKERRASTKER